MRACRHLGAPFSQPIQGRQRCTNTKVVGYCPFPVVAGFERYVEVDSDQNPLSCHRRKVLQQWYSKRLSGQGGWGSEAFIQASSARRRRRGRLERLSNDDNAAMRSLGGDEPEIPVR
jgi:hypothetical protein